jgi:hypothetical protein
MSDTTTSGPPATEVPPQPVMNGQMAAKPAAQSTSGWVVFAAVVLMLAGISRVLDAVWAFQYNRALPENLQGAVFGTSLNTYAWVWVIVGGLLIFVGLGLFGIGWLARSNVGRWIGIVAAGIGGISAMPWLPYYPVWSVMYVATAALVIYALVVHADRKTVT